MFSWTDKLSAFAGCLPCLRQSPSMASLSSPSQGQLRRLLADPESSSSLDAETLSLHSHPGLSSSRRRRQSKQRGVTLFGFSLFGRRTPAIQLSTDDTNDPLYSNRRIRAPGAITSTPTTQSAATFDSDAALLDPDTIDSISSYATAAAQAAEEEESLQKEERRKRRRERREIKKIAKALAASASEGGEFEGFQGSGDGYPGIPFPFRPSNQSDTRSSSSHLSQEHRSLVPSSTSLIPHLAMEEDDEDEGADLDGVVYTRRTRPPPTQGTKSLNRSSGSRSRTSTSLSDSSPYPYPQPPLDARLIKPSTPSSHKSKRNKSSSLSSHSHKRQSSKSTATRSSTTTRSDSPSLPSPTSPTFLRHRHPDTIANTTGVVSPSTIEQGQGFFDIGDDDDARCNNIKQAHSVNVPKGGGGGFPSTGFGINRGHGSAKSRDGAFLARTRGGELEDEFDGTF